jgi:uncharacterized protein YyaL (SSP411 family)
MLRPLISVALLLTIGANAGDDMAKRGTDALAWIETHLQSRDGLYAEHFMPPDGHPHKPAGPSTIWAGGVMLSALNAAAELDKSRLPAAVAYAKALDAYRWQKPGQPIGYQPFPVGKDVGDMYYDDNQWLVMGFLDTYKLTNDAQFLTRARDAYAYMASGESNDLGGGIWWHDLKDKKNTCSNAPGIVAALSLYQVDKKPEQLALAERLYAWVKRLQDADGLYWDAIAKDGKTIDKTKWSYNSALMIRANVMMYRVKRDAKYLEEAKRIADAAEAKWFRADGALTDEASFAHLLTETLLELNDVTPRPETVAKVMQALDQLAKLGRHNGYPKRWDGWKANETKIELLQQASAARAFLIATRAAPAGMNAP